MITFNRRARVFVCKEPTHLRASLDALFEKVRKVLLQDPTSGHLFVFINMKRTLCKCLYYDGTGLVILSKKMEERRKFSQVNPRFDGASLEKQFFESPPGARRFLKSRNDSSCESPING